MTIKNLVDKLKEFDEETEVKIGIHQKYKNDTAYEIDDIYEMIIFSATDDILDSCVAIYVGELSEEPYNTEDF